MTGRWRQRRWITELWAPLAFLALAMNLLSPPGFMVAGGGHGPAIVICTGHGPASLPGQPTSPNHKASHDGTCAFAGHGVTSAPPPLAIVAAGKVAPARISATEFADLAPGRGLAAPPPPSQAPPVLT